MHTRLLKAHINELHRLILLTRLLKYFHVKKTWLYWKKENQTGLRVELSHAYYYIIYTGTYLQRTERFSAKSDYKDQGLAWIALEANKYLSSKVKQCWKELRRSGIQLLLRRKNKNATIDFHLKIWFSRNDMFILAKES